VNQAKGYHNILGDPQISAGIARRDIWNQRCGLLEATII